MRVTAGVAHPAAAGRGQTAGEEAGKDRDLGWGVGRGEERAARGASPAKSLVIVEPSTHSFPVVYSAVLCTWMETWQGPPSAQRCEWLGGPWSGS